MQKDVPQPTDTCANASAQLLSPHIDMAHNFLKQCEKQVQELFCDQTKASADIIALGSDTTAIFTTIAAGVGAIMVPWLVAQGMGPAAAATAAVTLSALVAVIIMKIGIVAYCRSGLGAVDKSAKT